MQHLSVLHALRGGKEVAMRPASISLLTICGLGEVESHRSRGVTHVLSILDPGYPDPETFRTHDVRRRVTLRFHDEIEPGPGIDLPKLEHLEAILAFGAQLSADARSEQDLHALVHCHAGVSRSTAAMATLLAQLHPEESEDETFARLLDIRPQAWPNCVMIGFADELLGRDGRLMAALGRVYAKQLAERPEMGRYMRENGRAREVEMAASDLP
jgi:predicted protein tyrosine phosphatase